MRKLTKTAIASALGDFLRRYPCATAFKISEIVVALKRRQSIDATPEQVRELYKDRYSFLLGGQQFNAQYIPEDDTIETDL